MTILKVATYNIHKGTLGVGPAKRLRIHALQEGIKALGADLVFLQEVQHIHTQHEAHFTRWPSQPQAEFLAAELGLACAYETNARTRHGEHGNALLSRYPIHSIAHHDVSDHRFEQRGLLHVTVSLPKQVLHCIVVHLGLWGASRVRQIMQLHRYIDKHIPHDELVIVAGDFNDWQRRIHATQLGVGFSAPLGSESVARATATFPARMPMLALDRIYTRGLTAQPGADNTLPRDVAWRNLSDHAPLLANFLL